MRGSFVCAQCSRVFLSLSLCCALSCRTVQRSTTLTSDRLFCTPSASCRYASAFSSVNAKSLKACSRAFTASDPIFSAVFALPNTSAHAHHDKKTSACSSTCAHMRERRLPSIHHVCAPTMVQRPGVFGSCSVYVGEVTICHTNNAKLPYSSNDWLGLFSFVSQGFSRFTLKKRDLICFPNPINRQTT